MNARRVWVDPHVKKISSGVRAAVEGGESAESESEVESGDSSDSSGKGSNFSDGSQASDDDDDEIPGDDPEREGEAQRAYAAELRRSNPTSAKEAADRIRTEVRANDTVITLAYPEEADPDNEDTRLRPYVGERVAVVRAPGDAPDTVVIKAPLQPTPGRMLRWHVSTSRVKRIVGLHGTPLRATGRVPAPGDADQKWRAQSVEDSVPMPPRAVRL